MYLFRFLLIYLIWKVLYFFFYAFFFLLTNLLPFFSLVCNLLTLLFFPFSPFRSFANQALYFFLNYILTLFFFSSYVPSISLLTFFFSFFSPYISCFPPPFSSYTYILTPFSFISFQTPSFLFPRIHHSPSFPSSPVVSNSHSSSPSPFSSFITLAVKTYRADALHLHLLHLLTARLTSANTGD